MVFLRGWGIPERPYFSGPPALGLRPDFRPLLPWFFRPLRPRSRLPGILTDFGRSGPGSGRFLARFSRRSWGARTANLENLKWRVGFDGLSRGFREESLEFRMDSRMRVRFPPPSVCNIRCIISSNGMKPPGRRVLRFSGRPGPGPAAALSGSRDSAARPRAAPSLLS